jgi:hypothetical protein
MLRRKGVKEFKLWKLIPPPHLILQIQKANVLITIMMHPKFKSNHLVNFTFFLKKWNNRHYVQAVNIAKTISLHQPHLLVKMGSLGKI